MLFRSGAKGGYNYRIRLRGRSAHAATPELGINALTEAGKIMTEIENMVVVTDKKLGSSTPCVINLIMAEYDDFDLGTVQLDGKDMEGAPSHTLRISATYHHPSGLYGRTDVRHVGNVYYCLDTTTGAPDLPGARCFSCSTANFFVAFFFVYIGAG